MAHRVLFSRRDRKTIKMKNVLDNEKYKKKRKNKETKQARAIQGTQKGKGNLNKEASADFTER